MLDGFAKSPFAAFRCVFLHCDVLEVRLIPQNLRTLHLELFAVPSIFEVWRGDDAQS